MLFFVCLLLWLQHDFGRTLFTYFAPADYRALPQNWAFAQDQRGILYIGNTQGILEYDGKTWRMVKSPARLTVRSLALASDGTLYAGAFGDFGRIVAQTGKSPSFESLLPALPDSLKSFGDVWRTFPFDGGVVFFTQHRLFFFKDGTLKTRRIASTSRLISDGARLFQQEAEHLLIFSSWDQVQRIDFPAGHRVAGGFTGADGRFRLITSAGILFSIKENGVQEESSEMLRSFAQQGDIYTISTHSGQVFVNSLRAGVLITDRSLSTRRTINAADGLPDPKVYTSFIDRDGNLWLGLGNGLARYELEAPFRVAGKESGFTSPVRAVIRFNDSLYASTTVGLFHWKENRFLPVKMNGLGGFPFLINDEHGRRQFVFGDPEGMYIRSAGSGFKKLTGDVQGLGFAGDSGILFGGHKNGIYRFTAPFFSTRTALFQENGSEVHRLMYDKNHDRLWASIRFKGILRIENASGPAPETFRYGEAEGIVSEYDNDLLLLDGECWAGTKQGFRVFNEESNRFESGVLQTSAEYPGVFNSTRAPDGDVFWVGFGNGTKNVGWLRPFEDRYIDRSGTFNFLPAMDYESVFADSTFVWISGSDGLVRFEPGKAALPPHENLLLVRSFTAGEDSVVFDGGAPGSSALPESIVLPYAKNAFHITAALPGLSHENTHQYSFYLSGFQEKPSSWSERAEYRYANLNEGRYTLRVMARDGAGFMFTPVELRIQVLPPWYRSVFAYLVYVLLVAAAISAVVYYRTQKIQRQKQALERMIDERTAQLTSSNQELLRLNRLKNRFLEIADHDLRNPLTSVKGLAEVLETEPGVSDDTRDIASRIKASATRMADLVEELLGQAERKGESADSFHLAVDVEALIRDVLADLDPHFRSKAQSIHIQLTPGLLTEGDRALLRSVVVNLLSNASKYAPQRSQITVVLTEEQGNLLFSVRDNGQGLLKEEIEKVFIRFQKIGTKPTAGEKQTGLGLSLTREIVEMLGGSIEARSEGRGKGSEFRVLLPVKRAQR
jgi:signal transduction histidine kinase